MSSTQNCCRLQVLLQYKAKLESSLEEIEDMLKITSELLKYRVISKEFHNKCASLDQDQDHLETEVKVRYILQQVCERVREDNKVYDKLLRVLRRLGGGVKGVCEAMRKELERVEGGKASSGAEVGSEMQLVEQDIADLVKLLVYGSYRWEVIGVALYLPKHKLSDCGEGNDNVARLNNILTTWILGDYDGARPATLNSLRKALASEIVGLGGIAQKLLTYERPLDPLPVTKNPSIDTEIDYQSYDSEVAEGKSTLLEVQVISNGCESYQWRKDGQPILDGADFSGVSSNMLYINRASQGTEGKYSCCVSNGSETICTDEMNLMVIYPPGKEHLINLYSIMESEVPKDSWPPVGNSKFISLVLIKQKPMSRHDYYTIRGNVDDILESKEVVEYEEVFREYRERALVLVEGRPGSGKTTLVHKVTRDWSSGGNVLQGANLVFLITLRLLNFSGKDDKLTDLLNIFYEDELHRTAIECKLSKSGGKGACFIIDGLDEYQIEKKKDSVINRLINKKCLPLSMVIVTSRPVATRELKRICTKRVEVIGFSKDQIYTYLDTYPFNVNTCDMISKLKLYLGQHPNVLHMCYLPVHASMICYLFCELEGNIPHTETQIYEKFVIATLLRHKTRNEEQQQLKSFKDLRGEEKVKFRSICKLAFEMILNSQQVVSKSDAQVSLSDSPFLGLLTVERTYGEYGCEDLYTFQHLTCQEYLAAFHVSQLNEENLEELIEFKASGKVNMNNVHVSQLNEENLEVIEFIASDKVNMYNVWKLYCGLVEFGKSIGVVEKVFSEEPELHKVQCAFESQQVEFCDYVVGEGVLSFRYSIITSYDFMALGYVISNASGLVSKLCFRDCKWDSDGTMAFSSMVSKDRLNCIKYLAANGSSRDGSTDDDFKALNGLLGQLPFIEELDLLETVLGRSGVEYLTSNITIPKLQVLKIVIPLAHSSHPEDVLRQLTFGSHNIKQIIYSPNGSSFNYAVWRKILCNAFFGFQVFQYSDISWVHLYNSDAFSSLHQERVSCCTEVILVNCGIGDEGAEILANRLNTSVLENLVLDFNRISDSGAVALASCIARCNVVREISIQCNSIGNSGAIVLADALVNCSRLRRLDLQGNNLGDEGAVAIAKATESLPGLDLYLHNVNITEEGIEGVLEHRASTKIRAMVFGSSWDAISEAGIDALRSALTCDTLPALKISKTNIYNIETLMAELQHVRNIRGLECHDITGDTVPTLCRIMNYLCNIHHVECRKLNSFSSTSAELLSDSLKTCKSLHSVTLDVLLNPKDSIHSSLLYALKSCSNIHSLKLPSCKIGSVGISLLFSANKSWVNLHTLDFTFNYFGSDGAQYLSKVLVHYKSLRCLNLFGNQIGDSGAVALAEGLKDHTRLIVLNLGANSVTSDGIAALIQVIRCNHLQHLELLDCRQHSEGVAALADVMCTDTLQTLMLGFNTLGVDGTKSLHIGLKNCAQLVKLYIHGNRIGSLGLEYLGKGLRHCTNLQVLEIGQNNIKSDAVPAILGIMESCRYLQELGLCKSDIGVDDAAVLIKGWQNQSVLTLCLSLCFDDPHGLALMKGESCCNSCDHLLELYCNNDYVHIILDHLERCIPKVISAELI